MNCHACGQPLPELLQQFPDEEDQAYAKRLRREYKRETRGRARRPRGESEDELIEETYAILGVR